MYYYIGGAFVVSIFLAMIILSRILLISYKKRLFDIPDARKVHKTPVPRLGGLSFFPVIIIVMCTTTAARYSFSDPINAAWGNIILVHYLYFIAGLTCLYLVGVADDLIGVGYRYKFLVQFIAAALFPLSGLWINNLGGLFGVYDVPAFIGMPLTVFMVIYIINAINLIDGIDGLASGLSSISFGLLALVSLFMEQWTNALLSVTALGVLVVFFYYNVFQVTGRKLFMGDAGSLTLGYILSFLIIRYWTMTPIWNPFEYNLNIVTLSTLFIPLFDVVRVFLSRVRSGRNPFMPDKNHIHHKLIRTGMRTYSIMTTLFLLAVFIVALNYTLSLYVNATIMFVVDLGLWIALHLTINYFIMKREKMTGKIWNVAYNG